MIQEIGAKHGKSILGLVYSRGKFFCGNNRAHSRTNPVENRIQVRFSSVPPFCRSAVSGTYTLLVHSQEIPVYCHMGIDGCGNGGWTPAMKIDGKKVHFSQLFSSPITLFLTIKEIFFSLLNCR